MSERTERLPPMDQAQKASTTTPSGTTGGGSRRKTEGLEPERQPSFDAQEEDRKQAVSEQAGEPPKRNGERIESTAEIESARTLARAHLDSLDDAMVDYALAHSDWMLDNLQVYLQATGGAGAVQFEKVAVERLATNALRSAVQAGGRVVGGLVQSAARSSPTYLAGGAMGARVAAIGGVFGGITGALIGGLWGLIDSVFERSRVNKLVHAATSALSTATAQAIAQARASREDHLGLWHTRRDGLRNALDDARGLGELELLHKTIPVLTASARDAAAALRGNKDLAKALLVAWLKQTAKDDEDPGKDVNPVNYKRTRTAVGNHPEAADKSDLYIEQCRYEWGKLGVDAGEALAALGSMSHRQGRPALLAAEAPRRFRFTRLSKPSSTMAYLAAEGLAPNPRVVRESTQRPADLLDENPDKREVISHEQAARTGGRPARLLDAVMHGKVVIDCSLEYGTSERSTFVKGFEYAMEFVTTSGGQEFVKLKAEP